MEDLKNKCSKMSRGERITERVAGFCKIFLLAFTLLGCEPEKKPAENVLPVNESAEKPTPVIRYQVLNTYPHDSTSFTEGFLFRGNELYESTGATGYLAQTRSLFGPVDLKTGKISPKVELDRNQYFGEGITFLNNYVYQLTYTNQICFVYDAKTFKRTAQFGFLNREAWGLTTNGKELIMSDGTNSLTFFNPATFEVNKTLLVSENNIAVDYLNELEYIKGYIYANVWMTNSIVKIDPESGNVLGKMDLSSLAGEAKNRFAGSLEMNGIAYDSLSGKVLVTGKMWPKIFEIKFPI